MFIYIYTYIYGSPRFQIPCMFHTNIYGRSTNILEDGKSDIVICAQNVSR